MASAIMHRSNWSLLFVHFSIHPKEDFWITDEGNKYIQLQQFIE
jgi:hypothetical protein